MMKAAPTTSFIVAQPKFLLQFLIIPLDDPAMFGQMHQFPETEIGWQSGCQYLLGSDSSAGHSISNHSSGCGSDRQ